MIENEMTVSVPLEVVKASEIEPKEVKWLWYPYIPFGKVTLLQGDPGDGKSKLMLSIAALLSKGEPLPFTDEETEPMTIIYQTTEDDADDTVVPRFNSAGGNGENLIFIREDEKSLTFGYFRRGCGIDRGWNFHNPARSICIFQCITNRFFDGFFNFGNHRNCFNIIFFVVIFPIFLHSVR